MKSRQKNDSAQVTGPAARVHRQCDRLNSRSMQIRNIDPVKALQYCRRAYSLAKASNYDRGKAHGAKNVATCLFWMSDYRNALNMAYESVRLFAALEDGRDVVQVYNLIGNIFLRTSCYVKALEYYRKALALAQQNQDQAIQASAMQNMGCVYYALKDNKNALQYYTAAYRKFRQLGILKYQGIALMNIGLVHLRYGKAKESLACIRRALRINERVEDRHGQCNCWLNLGDSYFKCGQRSRAIDSWRRGLALAVALGDRLTELQCRINIAQEEIDRDPVDGRIEPLLNETLRLAKKVRSREHLADLYLTYSHWHQKRNDPRQALRFYKRYHREQNRIVNLTVAERVRGMQHVLETERRLHRAEIYKLRNIELAKLFRETRLLNRSLKKADIAKTRLLEKISTQAAELERLSLQDSMTGLYNMRYLQKQLRVEFLRSRRFALPLSIAMMDIDWFKGINDSFSHQTGDQILKNVAGIAKSSCRVIDLVARYGGDEFVMVFPQTNGARAKTVCERIRRAVQQSEWRIENKNVRVTVSIGIAELKGQKRYEALVRKADDNMYQAKRLGRNKVVL